MNWDRVIHLQRAALLRLVTTLFAAVGVSPDGSTTLVPRRARKLMLQVLRPAESAARRLILLIAHVTATVEQKIPETVQRPASGKPVPRGVSEGEGGGVRPFVLFDPRMRFDPKAGRRPWQRRIAGPGPRILSFDDPYPPVEPVPAQPSPDEEISVVHLLRRFASLQRALDDLPAQVRRLAKEQARHIRKGDPRRFGVMRPGRPPGHRQRSLHVVDDTLRELHQMALRAAIPPDPPRSIP